MCESQKWDLDFEVRKKDYEVRPLFQQHTTTNPFRLPIHISFQFGLIGTGRYIRQFLFHYLATPSELSYYPEW